MARLYFFLLTLLASSTVSGAAVTEFPVNTTSVAPTDVVSTNVVSKHVSTNALSKKASSTAAIATEPSTTTAPATVATTIAPASVATTNMSATNPAAPENAKSGPTAMFTLITVAFGVWGVVFIGALILFTAYKVRGNRQQQHEMDGLSSQSQNTNAGAYTSTGMLMHWTNPGQTERIQGLFETNDGKRQKSRNLSDVGLLV